MLYPHFYIILLTAICFSLACVFGLKSWKARGTYAFCAGFLTLFCYFVYQFDLQAQHDAFHGVYNDTPDYLDTQLFAATNVDIRDGDITLLMVAATNNRIANVKYLLARGANKTLKNGKGETASDLARRNGHTEVVRLLE